MYQSIEGNVHPPRLRTALLLAVASALFSDFLLLTIVVPILGSLSRPGGTSRASGVAVGILFSVKAGVQVLLNPFISRIVPWLGARFSMMLGLALLELSSLVFVVAFRSPGRQYSLLISARMAHGVASALVMNGSMRLITQQHVEAVTGYAIGLAMMGVAAGTLGGPPLGGILLQAYGADAAFSIVAGLVCASAIGVVAACARLPETPMPGGPPGGHLCELFRGSAAARTVVGQIVLANATVGMLEPLVPAHLHDKYGLTPSWQGVVFGLGAFGYFCGCPLAGRLCDVMPKTKWRISLIGNLILVAAMVHLSWSPLAQMQRQFLHKIPCRYCNILPARPH